MKTRIHINKNIIAQNRKNNTFLPAITAKTYKSNEYGHTAIIYDKDGNECARVVQANGCDIKPLSCGARVWIESNNRVKVICDS